VDGADLEGVFALRFLTDADAVMRHVRERSPRNAVVVGGGYIGLEVAESLTLLGIEVSLVEAAEQLAVAYGPEVAEIVEDHLREKGVRCQFTGNAVEAFLGNAEGRVRAARFGGREIEAEVVVAGVGIRPEISLAKAADAEIGPTGAIRTNGRLETSLPDVWAAGDCAETTNLVTGGPAWFPLGDTANQMGRVAGTNAALGASHSGDDPILEFPGALGTGIFKVFDLGVAKTGLSEAEAEEAGFDTVAASVESVSKAGYYPGKGMVFLKLIADGTTGRILGAETAGATADKLVDVCATAIWGGLSYPDLVNLDLAYAPPFGPVLSPIIQAASVLEGRCRRRASGVRAAE
jgi:NADPH-dependent 2,4-dienoyl-CoA reductase/sulfur reductase-like enzyme